MDVLLGFIDNIVRLIINPLILLLMALALAYFVWGAALFILNAAESEERKKGKQHLIWGLIGIFIMVSVFGILQVVTATFGVVLPN